VEEAAGCKALEETVETLAGRYGVVVIDTPGHDDYLSRVAHSLADTLITPLNDSFVDLDVLGTVHPETFRVTGTSHYARSRRRAGAAAFSIRASRTGSCCAIDCRCSARATSAWSAKGWASFRTG
jgi:hypothetical protein